MSRTSWLLSIGALALCACSKQEMPATSSTTDAALDAAPPVTASTELPAESSLSLKRGTLTLAADHATFQPCGESAPLWLIDQTDGVLRETFASEPKPFELYVEAHGERTPTPTETAAARAYSGAFLLEEVLYAMPAAEARGCDTPAPSYIVAARGNEPFWSVEVMPDDKMVWRQPEAPQELTFEALQSEDAEGTVGYSGTADGHKLELFIEAQSCRDSMSGAYFAYTARAVFDGKALAGCARVGD
jgi:uncharacterized membrane protein